MKPKIIKIKRSEIPDSLEAVTAWAQAMLEQSRLTGNVYLLEKRPAKKAEDKTFRPLEKGRMVISGRFEFRKHRKPKSHNWIKDFGAILAEQSGQVPVQYYPQDGWIHVDGQEGEKGRGYYLCKISSRSWKKLASELDPIPQGSQIQVEANYEPWGNKMGGNLTRIKVLSWTPPPPKEAEACPAT